MAIGKLKHAFFAGLTALTLGCSSTQPEVIHEQIQEESIETVVSEITRGDHILQELESENKAHNPLVKPTKSYDEKRDEIFNELDHQCNFMIVPGRAFQIVHSMIPYHTAVNSIKELDSFDQKQAHQIARQSIDHMISKYQAGVGSVCLQLMTKIYCAQNPKYARQLFLRLSPTRDIDFKNSPLRELRSENDELYRISAIALEATQEPKEFYEKIFNQLYERFGDTQTSYAQSKEVHKLIKIAREKMQSQ